MTPEQLDMHKRLQPLYKRVMGEGGEKDKILRLIIPLTIDSEHPERGLWGMLHNESWVIESFDTLDKITVKLRYPRRRFQVTNDPTTAILKALCEQERV